MRRNPADETQNHYLMSSHVLPIHRILAHRQGLSHHHPRTHNHHLLCRHARHVNLLVLQAHHLRCHSDHNTRKPHSQGYPRRSTSFSAFSHPATHHPLLTCPSIQTHPGLPTTWYRTPLDFLSGEKFHFYRHWAYYTDLTYKLHVPVFSREIKVKPWDRIPGDIWFPPEFTWPDSLSIPLGLLLQIPFCVSFLGAWDFHFPSQAEKVLWRVCAVYHAVYTLCGITYYLFVSFRDRKILGTWIAPTPSQTAIEMTSRSNTPLPPGSETSPTTNRNRDLEDGHPLVSHQVLHRGSFQQLMAKLKASAISLRNLSHDQNPDMAIPLRWTGAFAVPSVLYIFCRLYFYAEDIISLRNQPADVYKSVERVLPFI